jgi:outer membrane protein assembly factor BamB
LWRYGLPPAQKVDTDLAYEMKHVARVIGAGNERRILAVIDRRIVELDLQTGKETAPVRNMGFFPWTTPVLADLAGDGQVGLLSLKGWRPEDLTLVAMAHDGRELWQHVIGRMGNTSRSLMPDFDWPLVSDFDGDGRPEVLAPYHHHYDDGWVGVESLDAATGRSRWRTKIHRAHKGSAEDHGLAHFLVAPDLDKDGCRDIVAATLLLGPTFGDADQNRKWLVVAALSGADGAVLWHKTQPLGVDPRLGPLRWGPIGPDGLPRLIVPVVRWEIDIASPRNLNLSETVYGISMSHKLDIKPNALIFDLATGGLAHQWQGVFEPNAADFDGDGFPELHGLRVDPSGKGELHVLRGDSFEVVRRLGTWLPELSPADSKANQTYHVAPPLPQGDLDGDGVGDVVVFRPHNRFDQKHMKPFLQAYSGKDGRRLWGIDGALGATFPRQFASWCAFLQCRDLDGDNRPEVICVYLLGRPDQNQERTGWLAVLAGRSGAVLWKQQLGGMAEHSNIGPWPRRDLANILQVPMLADVNQDGVLDIVVSIDSLKKTELCACDGRNGTIFWRVPLTGEEVVRKGSGNTLVVASRGPPGEAPPNFKGYYHKISVLSVSDGRETWSWQSPPGEYNERGDIVTASLTKDGSRSICVLLRAAEGWRKPHVAVLSPEGKLVQKLDLGAKNFESTGLASHDLNGDGNDELLVVHDGKLHAYTAGPDGQLTAKPLWRFPLPSGRGDVLDVLPANAQRPAVVAVRTENGVHGLDGPTGKELWRRAGSGRPQRVAEDANGQVRVLFHDNRPESTIERCVSPLRR